MTTYRKQDMEAKEIAATLLTNSNLISTIYSYIKKAAQISRQTITENIMKDTHIARVNDSVEKRQFYRGTEKSTEYTMEYHPDDIMIVGGVAIMLYDNAISEVKRRRGMGPLVTYLKKNTTDIDMVWWPRISGSDNQTLLMIHSPAMKSQVDSFKKMLEETVKDIHFKMIVGRMLQETIENIQSYDIEIRDFLVEEAGVIKITMNVTLQFTTGSTTIELCDISIHDGASSQLTMKKYGSNQNHSSQRQNHSSQKGPFLVPMTEDPMYCVPHTQIIKIPSYVIFAGQRIAAVNTVPIIPSIIKQQLLAFNNLLKLGNPKCIINYRRIKYIQALIKITNGNSSTIRNLFRMPTNHVYDEMKEIDEELDRIINMHRSQVSKIVNVSKKINQDIFMKSLKLLPEENKKKILNRMNQQGGSTRKKKRCLYKKQNKQRIHHTLRNRK